MEGGGARGKKPPLHIVSWNVAAWAKTMQFIKSRHQSLRHYLRAHKIDILCLQETKITATKLANDPKIAGITPDLGYDSFWCWSSDEFKGFNGVATFARRGLTASASNKLCGDKDVNDEGRAIVTKHDGFAIINVYVPNSSGTSERLLFKMRFLHAVQRRMEDLEKEGLEVILCGDLNLTYRPEDVKWSWRSLQIDEFLDMQFPAPAPVESSSNSRINGIVDPGEPGVAPKQDGGAPNEPWDPVAAVKKFLPMLASLHCSHCGCNGCVCPRCRRVRPIETQCQFCLCVTAAMRHGQPDDSTTCISEQGGLEAPAHRDNHDNAARAERYMAFYLQVLQDCRKIQAIMKEKWPAVCAALEQKTIEEQEVSLRRTSTQVKYRVAVVGVNGKVRLGKPYMQRPRAERAYDFASAWTVTDDVTGNNYIAWRQNTVAVYDIAELLEKVCGVKLSLREQRSLCLLGHQVHALCAGEWLKSVLARDYVDTFVEFYPAAQGRFTCHDQYKNRRYENEGSRIDYFVISRRLFQRVIEGTQQQQQQQQYPPLVTAKNDIRPNEKASERHSTSAPCGLITSPACSNPFCEMCALSAVTHNGRWKPAPFDGSGITTGTKADYDAHITYPRNGIIYTPPQYSDHIAVSIVLGHPDRQPLSLDDTKDTKQTQPHLKIKRINSFFKQTSRKVEQALHETHAGSSEKGNEKTQEAMDKAGRHSRNEEHLRGREGEREREEQRNVVVDGGGDDDDVDDHDGKKERREERPVGADEKPQEESEDAGQGQEGVFVDDPASSRQNRDQGPPSNPYKRKSQTLAAFVQRGVRLAGEGNRTVRDGWEPADGEHSSAQHMQQPEEEQPQQEVSSAQRQKPPTQSHGSVERAEPKAQKLFGGALFSTFSTVTSSSPPLASQTPSPSSSSLTSPSRASSNSAAPTLVSEKQAAAQDKEGEEDEEVVASFPVAAPIIISESPLQQAPAMQARSHSDSKGMQPVNLLAEAEVMHEGVIEQFQFSRSGSGKRGPLPSVSAPQTVRCARAGAGMSTKKAKVGGKGRKNFSVRAPPRKKKSKKKPAVSKNTSSARKKPSLSPANPSASASIKGFFKQ